MLLHVGHTGRVLALEPTLSGAALTTTSADRSLRLWSTEAPVFRVLRIHDAGFSFLLAPLC